MAKNRKESILKNAESISVLSQTIADVGAKSANRGSTSQNVELRYPLTISIVYFIAQNKIG